MITVGEHVVVNVGRYKGKTAIVNGLDTRYIPPMRIVTLDNGIKSAYYENELLQMKDLDMYKVGVGMPARYTPEAYQAGVGVYKGIQPLSCDHAWGHYQGLFESFDHCTKCGNKKEQV